MPLAGQIIRALDFTPLASTDVGDDELGFTSTTYIPGAVTCGVVFIAPTSGRVRVSWSARFESNTINVRALVGFELHTGGVIGSGSLLNVANDSFALEPPQDDPAGGNARFHASMFRDITGLTVGEPHNVRTMHKMSAAGNGDIFDRTISVIPLF